MLTRVRLLYLSCGFPWMVDLHWMESFLWIPSPTPHLGPTALGEWKTSVPIPIPIPVGLARTAQHQAGHRRTRQGREQSCVSGQFGHIRVAWTWVRRKSCSLG